MVSNDRCSSSAHSPRKVADLLLSPHNLSKVTGFTNKSEGCNSPIPVHLRNRGMTLFVQLDHPEGSNSVCTHYLAGVDILSRLQIKLS